MLTGSEGHMEQALESDLAHARQTALVAHDIVIRLKEMGLPEDLDQELASLSTDLGDLWGAQSVLARRLEGFLRDSPGGWEAVGDCLVDLKASIDHMAWHLKSVRRPLNRIAQFAYRKATESETLAHARTGIVE